MEGIGAASAVSSHELQAWGLPPPHLLVMLGLGDPWPAQRAVVMTAKSLLCQAHLDLPQICILFTCPVSFAAEKQPVGWGGAGQGRAGAWRAVH